MESTIYFTLLIIVYIFLKLYNKIRKSTQKRGKLPSLFFMLFLVVIVTEDQEEFF